MFKGTYQIYSVGLRYTVFFSFFLSFFSSLLCSNKSRNVRKTEQNMNQITVYYVAPHLNVLHFLIGRSNVSHVVVVVTREWICYCKKILYTFRAIYISHTVDSLALLNIRSIPHLLLNKITYIVRYVHVLLLSPSLLLVLVLLLFLPVSNSIHNSIKIPLTLRCARFLMKMYGNNMRRNTYIHSPTLIW